MLPPRARIAVVAPSGIFDPDKLYRGMQVLAAWGYAPELLPGVGERHRYLAGTDAVRVEDLRRAFSGAYDAVWMARGGFGLGRLLRELSWDEFEAIPFLGFSDGTALLDPLAARGRPAVHAPVLTSLADLVDDASRAHLRDLLAGRSLQPMEGRHLCGPRGRVRAPLRGGNLCVLASLCGTPWQLDARDALVLLEEVGEAPYRVDRLLRQLVDSGALDGAAGVVLGDFLGADAPPGADWSVVDVVVDELGARGIPIVAGLPVGHGTRNHAVPLGAVAELEDGALRVHVPSEWA
jgi:muramoyltetrapeptide carboxypeptidase